MELGGFLCNRFVFLFQILKEETLLLSWLCLPSYLDPSPRLSLSGTPSDRLPATQPRHLAVQQEWCAPDAAGQDGNASGGRQWRGRGAAFLASALLHQL